MTQFIFGLALGLILGTVAILSVLFICGVGKMNKEQEAYMEGYLDGMSEDGSAKKD